MEVKYIPINQLPKEHPRYHPSNKINSKYTEAGLKEGMVKTENMRLGKAVKEVNVDGWTNCGCNAGWEAGVVLDPFGGSGTVGLVAERLGRNSISIDLNKEYCEMAYQRIKEIAAQTKLGEEPSTIERIGF